MFGEFLGGVKGYFGKSFVLAVWVPVLIVSFAIQMTISGIQGKVVEYWGKWLSLGPELQIFVGIVVFFVITLIAFLLHHLQFQIAQLFEGYWPEIGSIGKFKYWKRQRYLRQFKRLHDSLRQLGESIPLLEEKICQLEEAHPQNDKPHQLKIELQQERNKLMQHTEILSKQFPISKDQVLATSFGNRYRSAEAYAMARYGIDSVVFWPRLLEVVPEGLQGRLQDAKIAMDFWLLCSLLCALYSVVALISAVIFLNGLAILLVLLGAGLTVLCYRAALPPVMAYGELIRVAFDLYRRPLLAALDLEAPETLEEEKKLWGQLTRFINYDFPLSADVKFKRPKEKQ